MLLHIYVFYIGENTCMYGQMYNVFFFGGWCELFFYLVGIQAKQVH